MYVCSSMAFETLAPFPQVCSERLPISESQAPMSIQQCAVRTRHTASSTKQHLRPSAVIWAQTVGSRAPRTHTILSSQPQSRTRPPAPRKCKQQLPASADNARAPGMYALAPSAAAAVRMVATASVEGPACFQKQRQQWLCVPADSSVVAKVPRRVGAALQARSARLRLPQGTIARALPRRPQLYRRPSALSCCLQRRRRKCQMSLTMLHSKSALGLESLLESSSSLFSSPLGVFAELGSSGL